MKEETLAPSDEDVLILKQRQLVVLNKLGRLDKLSEMYEKVLKSREKVLGREHPDLLNDRQNVSRLLYMKGEFREAEKHQRKVVEGMKKVKGATHKLTLTAKHLYAEILANLKE